MGKVLSNTNSGPTLIFPTGHQTSHWHGLTGEELILVDRKRFYKLYKLQVLAISTNRSQKHVPEWIMSHLEHGWRNVELDMEEFTDLL